MSCVVCATRGGEGSRAAARYAARLSRSEGLPLVLLMVIDPAALEGDTPGLHEALLAELRWTGRALLTLAVSRAAGLGVPAEAELREGPVRARVEELARERDASHLVLGAPHGSAASVFGDEEIERFAASIEQSSGMRVHIARPEEPPALGERAP